MNREYLIQAIDEINHSLRFLNEIGWDGFDCSPESLKTLDSWTHRIPPVIETLDDVRTNLGDCRRCRLSKGRNNIVFGTGSSTAALLFVGEGPGYDEDRQGEPFVGKAGRLLTKIIEAINLTRPQVYICNVVKCRPPSNRNPEPDEIHTCLPFLERQIKVIKPKLICALGSVAARTLLDTTAPISRLRGRFHLYQGIPLMPTYHPAFLLRNPERKRDVWEDMKMLMAELEK
jgi:DNA polymerase